MEVDMVRTKGSVTIADVAREAAVSPATAGRALGNYGAVSDAVRTRVAAAADRLNYRPNAMARSMITGRTQSIGVVIADIEDQFFASLTRGISDIAAAAGLEVLVANSDERPALEARAVRVFQEKRVDGILLTPCSVRHSTHLRDLTRTGTPLVLIDRHIDGVDADTVKIDNRGAARQLVDHLLDLGHTRIAMVAGGEVVVPTVESRDDDERPARAASTEIDRYAGMVDALRDRGIEADPALVFIGGFHSDGARVQTERLLASRKRPTAIFASGNLIALGVLQGLNDHRIAVPHDISLVSFDDMGWQSVVQPPLTVVAQPVYEIGATATRRLLARLAGDESPPAVHELPTRLVVRGSAAAPRKRKA
jgi:LacI family transcriptional regulator